MAGKSIIVNYNVEVNDITPDQYPIKISYTHNGETSIVNNTQSTCYVLPAVSIVDEFWFRGVGYPVFVQEKSTIGTNDNTVLSFFIKSDSSLSYSHLTATATLKSGDDSRLTITPNFTVTDIGPSGKSQEYPFNIVSRNMPPGQYTINIHLFYDNQEVTTKDVILKVQA